MCGIFGFKSDQLSNAERRPILRKMGRSLLHRGPDDEGYYQHNDMAMGMRRLSIIDTETGKQPIFSNDRSKVIVFNGEIYNYLELRKMLIKKGYWFETLTDTEVIVNLYQEKGVDCLNNLNGMFVFAIYSYEEY
jgi:asparagine synthase (glutamine-hydrolysing)|tara:strand:- start:547 stop:948 length:402 start_codon:yes stop_codon:yes gene_type:complete